MQFKAFRPGIPHVFLKDLYTVYTAHYRDIMISCCLYYVLAFQRFGFDIDQIAAHSTSFLEKYCFFFYNRNYSSTGCISLDLSFIFFICYRG